MSRKLTKAEALYCAKHIEELYEMINDWRIDCLPQGEFTWPFDDFLFDHPGDLLWCTNKVYRRQPGGRLRRYGWETEISPMAVTGVKGQTLHVSVRGTALMKEWDLNFKFHPVPKTLHGRDFGWVHDGFDDAYETMAEALTASVQRLLADHPVRRLIVSGHSLGGALATLIFADLAYGDYLPDDADKICCTFGAPRVGNDAFRNCIEADDVELVRFENIGDVVPTMPPDYLHVGELIGLNFDLGSALSNHRISSYIAGINSIQLS